MIFEKIKEFFEMIFKENSLTDSILDFIENILPALFLKVKGFFMNNYSILKIIFTVIITLRTAYLIFFMNKKESVYNLHFKLAGQIINLLFLIFTLVKKKKKKVKA